MNEIVAWAILTVVGFITIPLVGQTFYITDDPSFTACFKRGIVKLIKFLALILACVIILWAGLTVLP